MKKQLFIIGAPRSGTNMLRNTLNKLDDFETWPCDEINHIWRHYNTRLPHDRFTEKNVTPKIKSYLRRVFEKSNFKKKSSRYLLEKTCANSLRIPFINEVFPEALYIVIFRNGIETTASATLRWKSSFNLRYTLRKVRFIPKSDFPFLLLKYLKNRTKQFFNSDKRLDSWGPIYPDMDKDKNNRSVEEISAMQWINCVSYTLNDILECKIEANRILYLSYDHFTNEPKKNLKRILNFLNIPLVNEELLQECVKDVKVNNKSNIELNVSPEVFERIEITNKRIKDFLKESDLLK